jgi:cytochrome P450
MRLLASDGEAPAPDEITEAGRLFDPFDDAYLLDPYPILRTLRDREPVFFSPVVNSWVVTRFATIRSILADPKRFSVSIASDPLVPLCPEARQLIAGSDFDVPALLVNNGTGSHPKCRRFFGEPLKPQHLARLRGFIETTVDRLIDDVVAKGPPTDLASGITWDLPALVLFRLLGVPDEDVPRVKSYADSRVVLLWGRPTQEEQLRLTRGALDFFHYTKSMVEQRVREPRDDYPSALLQARAGDDGIASVRDIVAVTFNLLFAGHETTSSAMANSLDVILKQDGLWRRIADGDVDMRSLVEEGLRFDPPVQAWRRLATTDCIVDGIAIPAGSRLLLHFGAGNHDGAAFADPEQFDPGRKPAANLTFGAGAHFCLGASLARDEMTILIQKLASRLSDLRRLPESGASFLPNTSFRGLRQLRVDW